MPTGLYPADPTTPIGQFRLVSGDWNGTPASPATEPQTAEYSYWSDDEITSFLAVASSSVLRACGHAYQQLAAQFSFTGALNKSQDATNDNRQRAADFRALALQYFAQADEADRRDVADQFDIIDMPGFKRDLNLELDRWPHIFPNSGFGGEGGRYIV